jgi:mono/diheme cytochrome c family protein
MKRVLVMTLLMAIITLVAMAGWRGMVSRSSRIEVYSDMVRQPKLRPQSVGGLSTHHVAQYPSPAGTKPGPENGIQTDSQTRAMMETGREVGSTNWLEVNPLPITAQQLLRGQERYRIFCSPCHGLAGDGRGVTIKYNMVAMANFHDKRLIEMPDGQIFNTITHGKNLMGAYGGAIPIVDRWAIVAYVRALERSRLATMDDVPAEIRPAYGR